MLHLGGLAGETSKTFWFTISEVGNDGAGVECDQVKRAVFVTVTDNGAGKPSVSDSVNDEGLAVAPVLAASTRPAQLPLPCLRRTR